MNDRRQRETALLPTGKTVAAAQPWPAGQTPETGGRGSGAPMQVPSRSGFRAESALPHHPLRVSFSPDSAFPTEATPQAAETSPAAEVTESSKSLSAMLRRTPSEKGFMPLLSGSSVSLGAQWRQIDEQRHERRVPCRLRRVARLLSWLLGLLILLTIVQELLFWAFSSHACLEKDEDVCSHNMVIVFLVSGKQIICTVLIMGLQFERTYAILRYRRRLLKARHCDATAMEKGMEVPSDHWTAVASLDIFNETATTVSESQLFLFVMVGSSTVVATSAQIRNALRRFETFDGQLYVLQACCPECQPFETNCSCDLMCQISCAGLESCLTLNVGCMVCLMASLLFIPLAIWSPVADAAFQDPSNRSMHHLVLKRTRSLPIPVSILAAVTACGIALYAGNFMMTGLFRGRVLWHMVLVSNVAVAAAASFLLLWSTGFWRLVALPVYLIRICISAGQAALARSRAEFVAESKWASRLRKITTFWRSKHSWRYRQLILLIANLYCFSIEALDIQSEGVSELYIGRVLAFVLLLVTRDAEIGPESLLSEGAGFGLIVNAKHLKQALQAHLSGRTYNRKMARYKATSIRMQETLAISYRWHDENGVDLGNGMELNITEWQTACILQVINTTGCLYVWMDKLAIPATDTKRLQKTLLSRMMAVYSSALVTLVLRSRETDGDRYHQRVWTLQEFCAANQLIVLTEDNDGREGLDEELICTAILDGEDFLVELLRREHMARRGQCVPVWLTDGGATSIMQSVPTDDARQIWETYKKLSTKLHCRYRADTVRALYPLLWNRPAESEPELVALLEALETVHGIPQTGLVELLRESSRREFRQVPNWDGSNGLASPCDVVPKTLLTIVDSPQKSPSPPTSAWSH